jgi:hypothetical protein
MAKLGARTAEVKLVEQRPTTTSVRSIGKRGVCREEMPAAIVPEHSPGWDRTHTGKRLLSCLEVGTGVRTAVGPQYMDSHTSWQEPVGPAGSRQLESLGDKRHLSE